MTNFNAKYAEWLKKRPLATKSATGATLSALNELISSVASAAIAQKSPVFKSVSPSKVLLLACYGGLINAPINHYGYEILNRVSLFKPNSKSSILINRMRKLVQLLATLCTISPVQTTLLVACLSVINSPGGIRQKGLVKFVLGKLRENLWPVLKGSWLSTAVLVTFAQNVLSVEYWTVFFSVCYTVLGIGQNVYMKTKPKTKPETKSRAEDEPGAQAGETKSRAEDEPGAQAGETKSRAEDEPTVESGVSKSQAEDEPSAQAGQPTVEASQPNSQAEVESNSQAEVEFNSQAEVKPVQQAAQPKRAHKPHKKPAKQYGKSKTSLIPMSAPSSDSDSMDEPLTLKSK